MSNILRSRFLLYAGIVAVLCTLSFAQGIAQERPQEMFNRGNYLLEQGDYLAALQVYREIEKNEFSSGPLYLNMGISYVHVDSLGLAKYYFLKAGEYALTRDKANEGVAFIESLLDQRRGALPALSWISFSEWLHFELNILLIIISGIILVNLGFLFIGFTWFKAFFQRTLKISGIASIVLGLTFIITGLIIESRSDAYSRAVMIESQTAMLTYPAAENEVVSLIYEGYTFTLDQTRSERYEGWKFVRLSNGLYGWVEEQTIREL